MPIERPSGSEYERADAWIAALKRLDRILEPPALSLVHLGHEAMTQGLDDGSRRIHWFPSEIDEKQERIGTALGIHAVATATIQRLGYNRRRYQFLKDHYATLDGLLAGLPAQLLAQTELTSQDPLEVVRSLSDMAFGSLSPLTTSEVFWLLVRAGENCAHGDLGFLSLFGLLWSLQRRLHGAFELGASLGTWRPTLTVTARALMPILRLNEIVSSRSSLWRRAAEVLNVVERNAPGRNQYERWQFASNVDRLSGVLHRLAEISIRPGDFKDTADQLTKIASPLTPASPTADLAPKVRQEIRTLLDRLRNQNANILAKAEYATGFIQTELLSILEKGGKRRDVLAAECKLNPKWPQQIEAAQRAHGVCVDALRELQSAVGLCDELPRGTAFTHDVLITALEQLATINDRVHQILRAAVDDNIEWCVRGVTREVAFASAGNDTEFDVTELLSGVVIGQRTDRISRAGANDAVRLALRSAREDGSWWSGQPVFLEKRFVGVWPSTPDIVLLLAAAVRALPEINCADSHLLRFVDWLDRRMTVQQPTWKKLKPLALSGWSSEGREPGIDVYMTATAVKALLEVRSIIEERLWEICEERFTVLPHLKGLSSIDPVDLGARHEVRLQTRLVRNAARAKLEEPNAAYSFVLHGPPGSSKTALAQAIGREMWRLGGGVRFVRITPADFTRKGEYGLDVEARFIFRLLSYVRGVTVFLDEIDDLLRLREIGAETSFIRLVIPGMLNRLQDLRDAASKQEICFLLSMNYVDQIEPALTRPGRIDEAIPIPYPDPWSRESILERITKDKVPVDVKEYVIENTPEWPWTTFRKLCDQLKEEPTQSHAEELVRRLRLEFQSPDYYYFNEKRWGASSQLVTEFVHNTFARSKHEDECREAVRAFVEKLKEKPRVNIDDLNLEEKFDTEWSREGRR